MRNMSVGIILLAAVVAWVYFRDAPRMQDRGQGASTTESAPPKTKERRLLEDRTFGSYAECDDAAKLAVQEIKDQDVSVALSSKSVLTETTIYKVYYPDATGEISCRGERLVNEIIEEK